MDAIRTEEHLKHAIHYIMQEWKTKGMVTGNSGMTPEEITETFFLTKKRYPSHGTREGYHYKFSFSEKEGISKEDALAFIQEWAEEYLGEDYDYVASVHHDRELTHMHLVFNSVKRSGGKYRYQKRDWNQVITPLTNRLCDKYGTGHLREKDKTLDYTPEKDWKGICQKDIDACLLKSRSYADFKTRLQTEYGYILREGVSKVHGVYLSLTPPGKPRAIRSYQLEGSYQPAELAERIYQRKETEEMPQKLEDEERKIFRILFRRGDILIANRFVPYIRYRDLTIYQQYFVKKVLRARSLYQRTNTTLKMHENSVRAIQRMMKDVQRLYQYPIRSERDLSELIQKFQEKEDKQKEVRHLKQMKEDYQEANRKKISNKEHEEKLKKGRK